MPVFGGAPKQLMFDVDSAPSFSPDGSRFVYLRWTPGQKDQMSEIHTANKDGGDDRLLYTSANIAEAPAWSPQGNQIAWIEFNWPATTAVKILDIKSKKATSISQPDSIVFDHDLGGGSDLAWLPDARHLLAFYSKAHSDRRQIGIVGVSDGRFRTLTNDVNDYSQLALSGDGKTLATILTNLDSSLAYYNSDGGAPTSRTQLPITPNSLAWVDEDHVFFITRGIGVSKLDRATGTLQPIDTGDLDTGYFINACADGHVLFTAIPKGGEESRLFRMNQDGSAITQITATGLARAVYCTPDSKKVYFTVRNTTEPSSLTLWSVPLSGGVPQKDPKIMVQLNLVLSRDTKLAAAFSNQNSDYYVEIWDLTADRIVHRLPLDLSSFQASAPAFSPDAKAIISAVASGNALRYQPIDGSQARLLTDPTADDVTSYAYSPSGSKLAVLRLRKSSDVVLITDLTGKRAH